MMFPIITTLLLLGGIQAGPLHSAESRGISFIRNPLTERDLPPCKENWPSARRGYTKAERAALLAPDEAADRTVPGWRPKICTQELVNCVYVQKGVNAGKGGFGRAALWGLDDGTTVEVYFYWQSTIQWTAEHGSINSYMAHGVDYVCVRGNAAIYFTRSKVEWAGDGIESDKSANRCLCYWPLDEDKILFGHNSTMPHHQ